MTDKWKFEEASGVPKAKKSSVKKKGRGWDNYLKLEPGLSIGTRQDQTSGIYYVRLRVDGRNKDFSLKTTSKRKAIILAAKKKEGLELNGIEAVKSKQSGRRRVLLHTKWKEFLQHKQSQVNDGEILASRLGVYNSIDKNWFGKYLSRRKFGFAQVNEQWVIDFWDWRKNYVGSEEHKRDARTARKNGEKFLIKEDSETGAHGLDNERKIIIEFLIWANRMGYTDKAVPLKLDKKVKALEESAEGLTYEEYLKLQSDFESWLSEAKDHAQLMTRGRVLFKFKLMLTCGTRVADLIQLQWKDVKKEFNPAKNKDEAWFIAKAKKKRRIVPITLSLHDEFMEWKAGSDYHDNEDYVFATQTGKSSSTDNEKWKAFLKRNKCLLDSKGKTRNMTTLRHTFASFAILYSDEKTSFIAEKMGTSERMIEDTYKDELARRENERYSKHLVPMMEEFDRLREEAFADAANAD